MDYKSIQQQRHQKYLEAENAKQQVIEQNAKAILKKLEEEKLKLERIEREEQFDLSIASNTLEKILQDISKCKDIIQLNLYISTFKYTLEKSLTIFVITDKLDVIYSLVIKMFGLITEGNIGYQYHKLSDYEKKIINNLKPKIMEILSIVKMEDLTVDIQTMDTSNDEVIARQLAQQFNTLYI
jgi:hypothetical protein